MMLANDFSDIPYSPKLLSLHLLYRWICILIKVFKQLILKPGKEYIIFTSSLMWFKNPGFNPLYSIKNIINLHILFYSLFNNCSTLIKNFKFIYFKWTQYKLHCYSIATTLREIYDFLNLYDFAFLQCHSKYYN